MPQRAASEAFTTNITELVSVVGTSASTNTSVIDVRANTQGGTAVGTTKKEALSGIRTRKPMLGLARRSTIPPNVVVPQATTNYEFAGSLPTPINVNRLEIALADHPNRVFVSNLLQTFRLGANIGFFGRRSPRFSRNLPTALAQPDIVKANLDKEVSLGWVAGPFSTPPFPNFQVSPIGLVPKKYSDKFRTIFYLSFPKSGGTSINYSISKEDFSLNDITIDTAMEGILANGRGCFLAKTDVDSAFRLIPLRPCDYELFGMQWEGKFYYKVLPFGLRSAPFLFNQLSEAVEWLLLNHCGISFVCHILDDFLVIEPPSPIAPHNLACQQSLSSMLLTFKNRGIPIAPHKTQGPSTTLEFMGIVLDSDRMDACLPPDKVQCLTFCFTEFKGRRSSTLKELQPLILQRMIQLTRHVSLPHHRIKFF